MKLLNKLKAFIRLQNIKQKYNDRRTFTNSIYNAIKNRPLEERSAIINDLKMINETELKKDYEKYQNKFNTVERALDISKFSITN